MERRKRLTVKLDRSSVGAVRKILHGGGGGAGAASGETQKSKRAAISFTDGIPNVSRVLPFVPFAVVQHHNQDTYHDSDVCSYRLFGAILFADVSGFTALNERMLKENNCSASAFEHVSEHLNAYFSRLIAECQQHGGDVIKFAGDALIVLFRANRERDLKEVTERATHCALEIQRKHGKYEADSFSLTLHIGVGCGELHGMHVGGVDARWEFLIAGSTFTQLETAVDAGKSGDVVLSKEAYRLCKGEFKFKEVSPSDYRVVGSTMKIQPKALPLPYPAPESYDALRSYVSKGVIARLDAGHTEFLGELRQVSVVFVNLQLKFQESAPDHRPIHDALCAMQTAIFRYEGMIRQILVDDKGTVLIGAFGVPPFSHTDDPLRAVRAALSIKEMLFKLGIICSIGVTTGNVFCGLVGSERRCEYAIVGDTVNLSARLMKAAGEGGVLCDFKTYVLCDGVLIFQALDPIKVKGKEDPVAIFRPHAHTAGLPPSWTPRVAGRAEHIEVIERNAAALAGGMLLLEGERGSGKSLLLEVARARLNSDGVKQITVQALAGDIHTPYVPWKRCLGAILQCDRLPLREQGEVIQRAVAALPNATSWKGYEALMNEILGTNLPGSGRTMRLHGELRERGVQTLASDLIRNAYNHERMVLLFDDIHHFDKNSWLLLQLVCLAVPELPLIATSLPLPPKSGFDGLKRATVSNPTGVMKLDPMDKSELEQLLCMVLECDAVDARVLSWAQRASGGSPSFAIACALTCLDMGIVEEDYESLLGSGSDMSRLVWADEERRDECLPSSVITILQSEMDELDPKLQLVLKICSAVAVVESDISVDAVCHVHSRVLPKSSPREVGVLLDDLLNTRFLAMEAGSYVFATYICMHACYGLCLAKQRREFHSACAEFLRKHGGDTCLRQTHEGVASGAVDLRREPSRSHLHIRRDADGSAALISDAIIVSSDHEVPHSGTSKSGSGAKRAFAKLKGAVTSVVNKRAGRAFAHCEKCNERIWTGKRMMDGKPYHKRCLHVKGNTVQRSEEKETLKQRKKHTAAVVSTPQSGVEESGLLEWVVAVSLLVLWLVVHEYVYANSSWINWR